MKIYKGIAKFVKKIKKGITKFVMKINRGSYMSAPVLVNSVNELGKRDRMRGLPSILSFFRKDFNKFNNTGA